MNCALGKGVAQWLQGGAWGVCEKAKFVRPYFEHTHTHAHGMEKSPVCIGLINFINANWTIPRLPATHATCYVLDEQQCSAVRGLHVKCATPYAAGAGLGPKRQSAVGFWVDPEIESENRCVRFKGNAGSACSTLPCQQFPSGPGWRIKAIAPWDTRWDTKIPPPPWTHCEIGGVR